jgi:hypothetical protein
MKLLITILNVIVYTIWTIIMSGFLVVLFSMVYGVIRELLK